jgi:hypothetical protein
MSWFLLVLESDLMLTVYVFRKELVAKYEAELEAKRTK